MQELLEMAPPSPTGPPGPVPKKGPRVPLPPRSQTEREAVPLLEAPAAPATATHSRMSSAAVSVATSGAVAMPARANLAPALTPVPAYSYRPQTYVTSPVTVAPPVTVAAPPVTVAAPPVTVAAPIVTSPVTVAMPAAPVVSQPMASAQALFDVLDANGDGVLDAAEFAQLRTLDGRRAQPPMEPVTVPNSVTSAKLDGAKLIDI